MERQRPFERCRKTFDGNIGVRLRLVRPRAEAAIDGHVGIQEERRHRLVVIELKEGQVHPIGMHDPDPHKLIE